MPIYEYRCQRCSHQFEMIHGQSEKGKKIICPRCGDSHPQRLVSSFSCGGAKEAGAGISSACGPRRGGFR